MTNRRIGSITLYCVLCAAFALGCSKQQDAGEKTPDKATGTSAPDKAATSGSAQGAAAPKATAESEEDKKRREREQRYAEGRKKDQEAAKKELARWTDDMRKQAADLVATDYKNNKKALKAVLASPHRLPGNSDRDPHRHPLDTLAFFGLKQNMTVLEAGAGGGWYTELLAPMVARKGRLIITSYDPNGPKNTYRTNAALRLRAFLARSPEVFGKVETVIVNPPDKLATVADGSLDMAIAIREMHNWKRRDLLKPWLVVIHKALKPGGVLGVVQHRAKPDADPAKSAEDGRLPQDWLIEEIEGVGFKLAGKSEINANPKDTRDYEGGVWALPPALRHGDTDKEKYMAIGESDRMTLKFVKGK